MDHAKTTTLEADRIESLIERFSRITATGPQQLAEMESHLERMNARAETILQTIGERIQRLELSCNRVETHETRIVDRLPQLERANSEARDLLERIDGLVGRLAAIEAASEERIAQLLAGLESAQDIHEKLETAGTQVSHLVEESCANATTQHQALTEVFAGLCARREELVAMIERSRSEAAETCAATAAAAKETRRRFDANRAEVLDLANSAEQRLADVRKAGDQLLDQTAHLKDSCITTLERIQSGGVAAIEQAAANAEKRIAQALSRFEALIAEEQQARAAAESAVCAARFALTSVEQSGARLAEAQANVANLESTAAETLATVRREARNLEHALDVAVQNGIAGVKEHVATVLAAAQPQLEQDVAQATAAIRVASTNAVSRADALITQLASRTDAELRQRHQEITVAAASAAERLGTDTEAAANAALAAVEEAVERGRSAIAAQAEQISANMAETLQQRITEAGEVARGLNALRDEVHTLLPDAGATSVTLDRQIREARTVTTAAAEQSDSLNALIDRASSGAPTLETLIAGATRQAEVLTSRSEVANECSLALAARQQEAAATCAQLAGHIEQARSICQETAAASAAGQALAPELAARTEELKSLLSTARELIQQFRKESESTGAQGELLKQLTYATRALEGKVSYLQESLANPISMIQDARAQAEELNDVCLAVKRVFRGISQASLQANDRIKLLSKLLVATERSARTMKQWVEEAARAQERLADTLAAAPRIDATHPPVLLPDLAQTLSTAARSGVAVIPGSAASDRQGASQSPSRDLPAARPLPQARTVTVPVGKADSAAKVVEPLIDVLKARASAGKAVPNPTPRLRAEDVQAMIAEAREHAPAGP